MFSRLHFVRCWLVKLGCALLAMLITAGVAHAVDAPPLEVDDRAAIAVWPSITLMPDPAHTLSVEQVLARADAFRVPTGTAGNLGKVADTVWLRATLHVPAGPTAAQRVLEIDYPPLNHIDAYIVDEGRVVLQRSLGNELPRSERPLQSRTHALSLRLAPGSHELLLRVQTRSSMVLPITLRTPEDFTAQESKAVLLQGLLLGIALCMLLYALLHWMNLRDALFLQYSVLLAGNIAFTLANFGVGAMVVWPDWPRLGREVAPLGVLLAIVAGASFMRTTLAVREISRGFDIAMRATGAVSAVCLLGGATGLLPYAFTQTMATVLGVTLMVNVVPVACMRALRGERAARYVLAGWAFYICGGLTLAGLVRGYVEPTFWSQHFYPLTTLVEMSAWMGVLGLRVQTIHRGATRARVESETLRTMAHTDALTGLPNRRGLQERMRFELLRSAPQHLLAVYLLDLDGFKPVNDRYGHDVGDALLVAVGQRLCAQLRSSDVVARLGGDEFVVLAAGLPDEAAARTMGQKMLAAFDTPFDAAGQRCSVGLTIGYALAPQDAGDAEDLLKRADAAMYAGKQAGRHQLVRGGRKAGAVTA